MMTMAATWVCWAVKSIKPKVIFISWAEDCSRSDTIARELGGKSFMVYSRFWGSNYATILFKYSVQFYRTIVILLRERPDIVYVMTPPTIVCFPVWCASKITRLKYVIDAHTGAFLLPPWSKLVFLHKLFSRAALATIVTNQRLADIVSDWGAKWVIVPDVPVAFPEIGNIDLQPGICMAYINTFTIDEPLDLLLAAAKIVPEVSIYVTGDTSACANDIIHNAPDNVIFTDFLSRASYAGLIMGCQSVICLTKLDHTMQRGAYEAIYLGKPVITSNFGVLRSNFPIGTVFVNNDVDSIADGIREMLKIFNNLSLLYSTCMRSNKPFLRQR